MGVIRDAENSGWRVVLVRFPLGSHLRQLEDSLPTELDASTLARELRIPYLDYSGDSRTAGLATLDGSHMTPVSAREFAPVLASDVASIIGGRAQQ